VKIKRISYLFYFLAQAACVQKFVPSVQSPLTGYLVVEGIINSGSGPTQITLTRSNALNDSAKLFETGAAVQVEGTDNSVYLLPEAGTGQYSANQLSLIPSQQYRMRITTRERRVYLSDFVPVLSTPPIDSISWQLKSGGVQIYANTHDPLANTRYYEWNYSETWEFQSLYLSQYRYDTTFDPPYPGVPVVVIARANLNPSIYTCWQTLSSTDLLLGSSVKLAKDLIRDMPIQYLPPASQKLSVEYSILVNQFALTEGAYQFLQEMKLNTEETGSIFDPQPSQLNGNIHCITNPSEQVIGYVSIASAEATRIFISNAEVPGWDYVPACPLDTIGPHLNIRDADNDGLIPIAPLPNFQFLAVSKYCVDCTLTGSNQKPSFWP
jgi:hypothetical protein